MLIWTALACTTPDPATSADPPTTPATPAPAGTGTVVRTDATLCVVAETPLWPIDTGSPDRNAVVDGIVTDLTAPCGTRGLTMEIADGTTLSVGWDWPEAPGIDLELAETVEITVREVNNFNVSARAQGITVRRGGLLIAAVELGRWGGALQPADHPEVEISAGAIAAIRFDDCGEFHMTELTFTADDTVSIAPTMAAGLTLAGRPATAITLAAEGWVTDSGSCADNVGETSWAVFVP